jgi:dihydrofolate reductase
VSQTLSDADATWDNTTVLRGDVVAAVTVLRAETERDILVHGSAQLVHTLIGEGLFDELRLMVFPVILGGGRRVFPDRNLRTKLALSSAAQIRDGIMLMSYGPADQ